MCHLRQFVEITVPPSSGVLISTTTSLVALWVGTNAGYPFLFQSPNKEALPLLASPSSSSQRPWQHPAPTKSQLLFSGEGPSVTVQYTVQLNSLVYIFYLWLYSILYFKLNSVTTIMQRMHVCSCSDLTQIQDPLQVDTCTYCIEAPIKLPQMQGVTQSPCWLLLLCWHWTALLEVRVCTLESWHTVCCVCFYAPVYTNCHCCTPHTV